MASRQHGNSDGLYLRLEVLPGASHDEIARAYRRLAHEAHPDAHPGDPDAAARFREITEAYEVLGHPDRRERYDRARRQAGVGTDGTSPAPAESSPRPGPAQVFASPPEASGPPVFLGTGPVIESGQHCCWPGPRPCRAAQGRPSRLDQKCEDGPIGAVAARHVRAEAKALMEWPELDHGMFAISVAAELSGLHPQTLRIYEREGLIEPGAALAALAFTAAMT